LRCIVLPLKCKYRAGVKRYPSPYRGTEADLWVKSSFLARKDLVSGLQSTNDLGVTIQPASIAISGQCRLRFELVSPFSPPAPSITVVKFHRR
jgi:hypothetical protein